MQCEKDHADSFSRNTEAHPFKRPKPGVEYVFSETIFPLSDQSLSLETCLGSLYARNMFPGSIYPLKSANTDCETVI